MSSPQGRFATEARKLNRDQLLDTDAWGKHLFYHWESGRILHVHLGLYGKFRKHKSPPPEPRGAVRMRVVGDKKAFDLIGPTRCELISESDKQQIIDRLGEDPLRDDADPEVVWNRISRSRARIGTLLLNQSIIAGVGNVFRADALFDQGIHPERPGRELSREEFDALWQRLCEFLAIGVRYNRIITADPEIIGRTRGRMRKGERVLVYSKSTCPECESAIDIWDLGNGIHSAGPRAQAAACSISLRARRRAAARNSIAVGGSQSSSREQNRHRIGWWRH